MRHCDVEVEDRDPDIGYCRGEPHNIVMLKWCGRRKNGVRRQRDLTSVPVVWWKTVFGVSGVISGRKLTWKTKIQTFAWCGEEKRRSRARTVQNGVWKKTDRKYGLRYRIGKYGPQKWENSTRKKKRPCRIRAKCKFIEDQDLYVKKHQGSITAREPNCLAFFDSSFVFCC